MRRRRRTSPILLTLSNNKRRVEVESLHSLLTSQTSTQRVLALSTSSKVVAIYDSWRDVLIKAMSHTEAIIDFSSDSDNTDLQEPELIYGGVLDSVKNLRKTMERHLEDGYKGELITNGVKVCLTGEEDYCDNGV